MRAHIRSVKPEALTDEALWDLEQETGLPIFRAFVGLWTQADREGRFEWRARPLKAAVLPYWDGDFSRVLDALCTRGFLVKYEVDGREYGLVRTFHKHQLINNRELASVLPPPPKTPAKKPNDSDNSQPRATRVKDASTTGEGNAQADLIRREQKGAEGRVEDAPAAAPPEPLPIETGDGDPDGEEPETQTRIRLSAREVDVAWCRASGMSLRAQRQAMEAFASMAEAFEREEGPDARVACWAYMHWVFQAPDGPVNREVSPMRHVRPWSLLAGLLQDLPAAARWFSQLSEHDQARYSPPRDQPPLPPGGREMHA